MLVTKPRFPTAGSPVGSCVLPGPQLENEVLLLVKIQNEADDRGLYLTNVWLECKK